jgi:hypothetical protein
MQLLSSRVTVLAALGAVIVLGGALMATSLAAARTEADLRARIAELTRVNGRQGVYWQARLQACETAAGSAVAPGRASAEDRARRLVARGPRGFDVCARMESADEAVLQTLK